MPRSPRIHYDGAVYHVTCRGDNREPVFYDESDYQEFLLYVRRYKNSLTFLLYSYCLMPNHLHLVIRTNGESTISKIMHQLILRYVRYFNRRHGRVGHLFQGRFRSSIVEKDEYLLTLSRYVHLNPVKASLCRKPQDYSWSSYRAYLSKEHDLLDIVDSDLVLALVSPVETEQVIRYRGFVESFQGDELNLAPNPQIVPGTN